MKKPTARQKKIREKWTELGAAFPLRDFGRILMFDLEFYTTDELHDRALTSVMREIETALKIVGDDGLPMALASSEKSGRAHIWKNLEMFQPEDYQYAVTIRVNGAIADSRMTRALYTHWVYRYPETVVDIPGLDAVLNLANGH